MHLTPLKLLALGLTVVVISACDPESIGPVTSAANSDSSSNSGGSTVEILAEDFTSGEFGTLTVRSSGVTSSGSNGTLSNPIVLNKDENFTVEWTFTNTETALFSLELKDPENPDTSIGGFFSFNQDY